MGPKRKVADSDSEVSDDSVDIPVKKRQGKKQKKDKAPRAKSAYQFYVSEQTPIIKGEHPDMKLPEVSRAIAEKWKNLSDEDKAPYNELAAADKASKHGTKDSGKPKRPPSSYLCFTNAMRAKVKEENPELKMTDISKVLGNMWSELSAEEKKPYEQEAKVAKAKYDQDVADFNTAEAAAKVSADVPEDEEEEEEED